MKDAIRTAIVFLVFAAVASAQTRAGGEFRVNTYTTDRQMYAKAAMEPDGDFVVVWTSRAQDGSNYGAFGQRFAASGVRRGSEFRLNTYTTGFQGFPAVAVGSRGDFVAVWHSEGQDGLGMSVQGRRFDAAGNAIGGEFLVNTYTTASQYRARVARAPDGRFVVSWMSLDGSSDGIAARRFDASGNPLGSDFVVNTYTTGGQRFGDVAVEANGNFVVVWENYLGNRDGSGSALFGQRYDASGNLLGSEFLVNTYTTGNQRIPSVSMSAAGGFVASWSGPGDGNLTAALARRFDASGNPIGNDFVVNTYTTGYEYTSTGQVAHDARGNFVVTWMGPGDLSNYGVFAQRFSAAGVRRAGEFLVNSYLPFSQTKSSIASDSVGNFTIVWESRVAQDGSDWGIYAQRYGGLFPAALAVDSPGNLVLEPGETVQMRPSWRNFNGATQAFSGTISNITGPPGATYTITDAFGNYGNVPSGAIGQCTDCYAVAVSNPTTRPAVHWDASAVESLAPDDLGQQKQWLLHVGGSFTDVATSNAFYRFIETLLHHSITGRLQRDPVLPGHLDDARADGGVRARGEGGSGYVPPACTTPVFNDVPANNPFAAGSRSWPGGRGERMRRRQLLPVERGHPGADGGLRAAHAGSGARAACLPHALLQRRSRDQRVLPLDRGADPARRGHRLRRRQLLSDRTRDPRADGGLHQRDVRVDPVRAVTQFAQGLVDPPALARLCTSAQHSLVPAAYRAASESTGGEERRRCMGALPGRRAFGPRPDSSGQRVPCELRHHPQPCPPIDRL